MLESCKKGFQNNHNSIPGETLAHPLAVCMSSCSDYPYYQVLDSSFLVGGFCGGIESERVGRMARVGRIARVKRIRKNRTYSLSDAEHAN